MVAFATNPERVEKLVMRHIQDHSGLTMRSHTLLANTRVKTIKLRSGVQVKVSNTAKYAAAQDLGSGLYGPKRQKYMIKGNPFLRFTWKGQVVYFRYVMHPGVRPTRFLYRATTAAGRTVASWIETRMQEVARKF